MGGYDETPEQFGENMRNFAIEGLVNMVGGCCGTSPEYIKELVKAVEGIPRRIVPENKHITMFSGLTEFIFRSNIPFVNIGERCNISGSLLFKKMIVNGDYEKAAAVAKQ
jgi:5-methyltetrahydrofolate--homocysteine methyltransferase